MGGQAKMNDPRLYANHELMITGKGPISLLVTAALMSCTTVQPSSSFHFEQDEALVANESQLLSANEMDEDISMVQFALEHAYIGSRYLPSENFQKLKESVHSLKTREAMKAVDFCTQVGNSLQAALDSHLSAQINKQRCGFQTEYVSSVGSNYGKQVKQAWEIQYRRVKKRKIPILSIHFLPAFDASDWKGYPEAVEVLKTFESIVVDLRDNGGGDDSRGYEPAESLAGQPPESAYKAPLELNTVEAISSFKNTMIWYQKAIGQDRGDGQQYAGMIEGLKRKLVEAQNGNLPEVSEAHDGQNSVSNKSSPYEGTVYVLVNRKTASSGESSAEALRALPKAKLVGENTAGYIHFGNKGQFQLPHSKIVISMGTHFTAYKDGKFLEKVGMSPDISVPAGEDALDWLIANRY